MKDDKLSTNSNDSVTQTSILQSDSSEFLYSFTLAEPVIESSMTLTGTIAVSYTGSVTVSFKNKYKHPPRLMVKLIDGNRALCANHYGFSTTTETDISPNDGSSKKWLPLTEDFTYLSYKNRAVITYNDYLGVMTNLDPKIVVKVLEEKLNNAGE